MSKNVKFTSTIIFLLTVLVFCTSFVMPDEFSFGLWGDMPYSKNNDGAKEGEKMTRLLMSMNSSNLAFTIFDGDTKDGSSDCTDQAIGQEVSTLFNSLHAPTVYVLGDNEWTDCHRINNGGYNNLERLDYLRQHLFSDNYSFGKTKMQLHRQGTVRQIYSENVRWRYGRIFFVGLNIPGSNNNKVNEGNCVNPKSVRTQVECDADNHEYLERDKANISFLQAAFQEAKQHNALGLVLVIHADPGFDLPETESINERAKANFDGYTAFLAALATETNAFSGQVLLVHGDTHYFKVDKPLIDQAHLLKNFTRIETFGSPNLHWVKVTVNANNPNVFTFQPMLVQN